MVTINQDGIGNLLLAVEAKMHQRGWDERSEIMVVYDANDQDTASRYHDLMSGMGVPVRYRTYAARPMAPARALDGFASHSLFRMAANLGIGSDPRTKSMIGMMRQPGFLGLAMVFEAWSREYSRDEKESLVASGVRFADIPGSMEERHVVGADITGTIYSVRRIRGKTPTLTTDAKFTGSIPESLCYATAAIAGTSLPKFPIHPSGWDDRM